MRFYVHVFVGQVPAELGVAGVQSLFQVHGKVLDVSMLDSGAPTSACFVVMEDASDAERAISAINDSYVEGTNKKLTARFATGKYVLSRSIFVGSLPPTATIDAVTKSFLKFGKVKGVHMLKQRAASGDKCALVHFRDRQSALAALSMNGTVEGNRSLEVRFATAKVEEVMAHKPSQHPCDCHRHNSSVWVHHPYASSCPRRHTHEE